MIKPPIPFDESQVKDKFWQTDPWDGNVPAPGFISDLVLTLRGIKTPTKYQVWSALWLLSSVIKRDAWLEWGPLPFYFNLFIFLVGPPAIGKTAALDWADYNILNDSFPAHFASKVWGIKKTPRLLHSKGTAEGIFKYLKSIDLNVKDEEGRMVKVSTGSTVSIITGELSTFLGRQQYNVGLIEKLTRLYDCAAIDDDLTKGESLKIVRDPYVTLIGGITPDGMAQSIPEASFGDGFLSRVIIVFQDEITRINPFPRIVMGSPSCEDLRNRLAWIASNAKGRYHFSPEAGTAYDKWYREWMGSMNENPALMKRSYSRYDIHLLKVAALIRANRYSPGQTIEIDDFNEAIKILDATFKDSPRATEDVGADPVQKCMNMLEKYISSKGGAIRKKFLQCYSGKGLKASVLNQALSELIQSGRLRIWDSIDKTKEKRCISSDGEEFYEITI